MGRSRAMFSIPNVTAFAVLQNAAAFGEAEGLRIEPSVVPNQLTLARGSVMINGKTMVVVIAWDAPGGANVSIEAWLEGGWAELNADPKQFVGMLPRRALWNLLGRLCAAIGAPGATAMFQHM